MSSGRWPSPTRLLIRQVRHHNRMFWRTPIGAFFTLALPVIMLVLFNALFDGTVDGPDGPIDIQQFYTAGLAVFSAASATYTNIGINISIQRDDGVLKRVRGTPLRPATYLAGAIGSGVWLAFVGVVLMIGLGVVFYGLDVEAAKLPAAAVTFAVGVGTFAALGLALSALAPTATAAPAIANATILPMAMISDVFIPLEDAPGWLERLGDILPLKPFARAFQAVLNPIVDAPAFRWRELAVMAAWGVGGVAVALRFFRWEARAGATGRRSRRRRAAPTA